MITLKLPSSHPNSPVLQKWATDKEQLLNAHTKQLSRLEGVIKLLLEKQG